MTIKRPILKIISALVEFCYIHIHLPAQRVRIFLSQQFLLAFKLELWIPGPAGRPQLFIFSRNESWPCKSLILRPIFINRPQRTMGRIVSIFCLFREQDSLGSGKALNNSHVLDIADILPYKIILDPNLA